jgi:hypothetical protein
MGKADCMVDFYSAADLKFNMSVNYFLNIRAGDVRDHRAFEVRPECIPRKKVFDGVEEEHGVGYLVVGQYPDAVRDGIAQWFSCVGAFELNPEIGIL